MQIAIEENLAITVSSLKMKNGYELNRTGLKIGMNILDTRSEKGYPENIAYFGKSLETRAAHPHQKFRLVAPPPVFNRGKENTITLRVFISTAYLW